MGGWGLRVPGWQVRAGWGLWGPEWGKVFVGDHLLALVWPWAGWTQQGVKGDDFFLSVLGQVDSCQVEEWPGFGNQSTLNCVVSLLGLPAGSGGGWDAAAQSGWPAGGPEAGQLAKD